MRSMLDIYRADGNQITVAKAPVDIKQDILMPVSNILYKRLSTYDVIVDCPDHLVSLRRYGNFSLSATSLISPPYSLRR